MSYTEESLQGGLVPHVAADAIDLTSASVHTTSFAVMSQVLVTKIMALVHTLTVSTGGIVVAVKYRPTYGSAASEVTMGSLTIPTAAAVGKVYYKSVSPVACAPGGQIVFEVTTAAAGGGAAGKAIGGFECELDPEYVGNQTAMVASA